MTTQLPSLPMSPRTTRREFLAATAFGAAAVSLGGKTRIAQADDAAATDFAFFVIGDTHYHGNRERPTEIDPASAEICGRLVETLNRLPGEMIPNEAGGGQVAAPQGVIHAGDVIDSGDKNGPVAEQMQVAEWSSFTADYGLTGKDGKLKYPVYELAGNHDSPGGQGLFIDKIKERNPQRPGVVRVSDNGVHYSWDWGGTHFVNLGLIVGTDTTVERRRRYAALDSLQFLIADLKESVGDSGRPIVISHHVDVARYTGPCDAAADPETVKNKEWDPCDVRAFYKATAGFNIAGIFYGHTHGRAILRWDGESTKGQAGLPVFNTDNASHFAGDAQAFFYVESRRGKLLVREYQTKDRWQTGFWTPAQWTS